MKTLWREPMLHFTVIGLLLYLLYIYAGSENVEKESITLSQTEVSHIQEEWKTVWRRDPASKELHSLITKKMDEKMMYNEALAMQLERDDPQIYKRLVEKVYYILTNIKVPDAPSDTVLKTYYENHRDDYRIDGVYSFSHVFVDMQQPDAKTKADKMLSLLTLTSVDPKDANGYADAFTRDNYVEKATPEEITKTYGWAFAQQISSLKPGEWQGPLLSRYGFHLVYITERSGGSVPAYDEVRYLVEDDYLNAFSRQAFYKALQKMRLKYNVATE